MLAYVGLDPRTDVRWVTHPGPEAVRLLAAGRIDAFMSIPPQAQELRARKIGRLVVDTSVDRGRPGASSSGDSRRSMTTHLQTMKDVPYNQWRAYNPEDAVRFYSLRLHEIGMIKTNPQKLIAQGTDWRFLNELKMELKG
jgi:NitT/TauT family transport system substrate-binding protein